MLARKADMERHDERRPGACGPTEQMAGTSSKSPWPLIRTLREERFGPKAR